MSLILDMVANAAGRFGRETVAPDGEVERIVSVASVGTSSRPNHPLRNPCLVTLFAPKAGLVTLPVPPVRIEQPA
jgi:hypothetical protein